MNRLSQLKSNVHLFATDLGDLGAGEFFCPNCGAPIMVSDKTCANCGFDLVAYREGRPQPKQSATASQAEQTRAASEAPTSVAGSVTSAKHADQSAAKQSEAVSSASQATEKPASTAAKSQAEPAGSGVDQRVIKSAASAAAILSAIDTEEKPEEVIAKLKQATKQLEPKDLGRPTSSAPKSATSLSSRREAHIADKTKDISDIVDQVRAATDSEQPRHRLQKKDLQLNHNPDSSAESAQPATRMARHEQSAAASDSDTAAYSTAQAITPEERAATSLQQNDATSAASEAEGSAVKPAIEKAGQKEEKPQQRQHKTHRKWWIGLIVVVVVLLGAFFFGKHYYSRTAQLNRAFTVLATHNPSKVSQVLASTNNDLRLTPGNSRPFIRFIKANPDYLKNSKKQLTKKTSTKDGTLGFVKQGKHFIFPAYQLTITPTYRTIATHLPSPSIYLDGQNVTAEKPTATQKIGPFMPGTYTLKVEAKTDDKTLTRTVHPTFLAADAQTIDLTLKPVTPVVHSNVADATVYVNNQNKGQLQNGKLTLAALTWEPDLKLHLETKLAGKTVKTKAVKLTKKADQTVQADFTAVPTTAQTTDFLTKLYQTVSTATNRNNQNDTAALAGYFKSGTDAAAYKKLATFITQARNVNSNIDHTSFKVTVNQVLTKNKQTTVDYNVTYTTNYLAASGLQPRVQTYRYSDAHLTSTPDHLKVIDFGDHEEKVND